ncbi:MAG TPA: DUF4157 domain-containing protein [Longimicrobium sp.]|nr:DUF4157 domain-containing protein [Longimicrobium sp.]
MGASPRKNAETLPSKTGAAAAGAFAHDLSRVPVFSPAPVLVQAKLSVNRPGDLYEKEAERVSDLVMRMPDPRPGAFRVKDGHPSASHPAVGERLRTTRLRDDEQGAAAVPAIVHEVLRSSGQPLDTAARAFLEPRFGHDFSRIRIHADAKAAESARSIGALAYTAGDVVVFGAGQYASGRSGQALLAHELVHTLQQRTPVGPMVQRQVVPQAEWETDRSANGKAIDFETKAEAELRRSELEKEGKWEQYEVSSFNQSGKTSWRVRMRGTRTMSTFLALLQKAEKAHPTWTKEQMINSLRRLGGYDTERFQTLFGTGPAMDLVAVPEAGFEEADVQQLRGMLRHSGNDASEAGIVKDFSGEYLAMGHVMTGISGGLHRNKQTDLALSFLPAGEKVDNLYAATLAGDLGQSAVLVNEGAQTGYVGAGTEATDAELVGDIDGLVIGEALAGAQFRKTWDTAESVSDFLAAYYKKAAPNRFAIASKLSAEYLKDQTTRFAETFAYRNSKLAGLTSAVGAESEASNLAWQSWLAKKTSADAKKKAVLPSISDSTPKQDVGKPSGGKKGAGVTTAPKTGGTGTLSPGASSVGAGKKSPETGVVPMKSATLATTGTVTAATTLPPNSLSFHNPPRTVTLKTVVSGNRDDGICIYADKEGELTVKFWTDKDGKRQLSVLKSTKNKSP